MEKLYAVKEKLCEELKEYGSKDKLDVTSLELIDKLAHAIKNIDKIIEKYEEGSSYRGGSYDGSYGGSYARGRGRSSRRNAMGQYSSAGGGSYGYGYRYPRSYDGYSRAEEDLDNMISYLHETMQDLPPEKQRELQRFIDQM